MIVWLFDASCEVIHVVSTQSTKSTSIWCFLSWLFTIWMLLRPRFPTHLLLPTGTTFQIIWTLASVHTQIQSIIRFVGQMLQSMMDRVSCLNNAEQREDIKHFEKLPLSNAQFIFIGFVRVELLPWIECLPVTLGCTTHHQNSWSFWFGMRFAFHRLFEHRAFFAGSDVGKETAVLEYWHRGLAV